MSKSEKKQAILEEVYYAGSAFLAMVLVMELVWPGIAIAYISINTWLIFWLIFGIVLTVRREKNA